MSFYETLNWYERLFWSRRREEKERNEINLVVSKEIIKHLEEDNEQLKEEIEKLKAQL